MVAMRRCNETRIKSVKHWILYWPSGGLEHTPWLKENSPLIVPFHDSDNKDDGVYDDDGDINLEIEVFGTTMG